MNRVSALVTTLLLASFGLVNAQKAENGKVIITGSRFTYPLIEKWISEFKKEYPDVQFKILARGNVNADSANLIVNAHKLQPEEIKGGSYVVNIGRYALLPVANAKNPLVPVWATKGIKEKQLKKLFFKKYDPFAENEEVSVKAKVEYVPTVYTRAQKACAPITFAKNYGFQQDDIIGKIIGGDDHHLITAIEKDTNGITYNNLGFIYNTTTRLVKDKLAVVPIDLNSNGKLDEDEKFYGTLDAVIARLERGKIPLIPIEHVNITYPGQIIQSNKNVSLFLDWVLNNGQKYNHELGFLDFEPEVLAKQKEILVASYTK
jgi:phosphate transport system substrate-binding protein